MMTRGWNGRRALPRRTVLRGMFRGAAITVGLPTLESMLNTNGTAHALDGEPTKKYFGLFTWSHGMNAALWIPAKVGRGSEWSLSPEMMPLAAFKDHISVVSGTWCPVGGHVACPAAVLTGGPYVQTNYPEGGNARGVSARTSIDHDVAAAWADAGGKPHNVMVVGVCPGSGKSEGPMCQTTSFRGFNDVVLPLYDPREAFNGIFGSFMPPAAGGTPDPRTGLRQSVLDVVKENLQSLKREVGNADRMRLEDHFQNILELERSIAAPVPVTCEKPAAPPSLRNLETDWPMNATGDGDLNTRISQHMADLVATALACGRTRIFNLAWARDTGGPDLKWLGSAINKQDGQPFKFQGHHGMSHDEARAVVVPGLPAAQPFMHKGVVLAMQSLGYLLARLKERTDGANTLLHNSAILCMSHMNNGGHAGFEIPIFVAGKAGGALKGDIHVNLRTPPTPLAPNAGSFGSDAWGNYSVSTLRIHLTALRALGLNQAGYGIKSGFALPPADMKPEYYFRHGGTNTWAKVVQQNFYETASISDLLA